MSIPVVRYADCLAGGARQRAFDHAMGQALEAWGFVAIQDHPLAPELLDRCYAAARATFALPTSAKQAYETPEDGRQRGYTSFGVEHAKDSALADLKEFWHVGRTLPADHRLRRNGAIPPNRFPDEVPAFGRHMSELFTAADRFSEALLASIGRHLGLPDHTFEAMTRDGNSVLRVIHYPPLPQGSPPGSVRAAQHEDINLITVLPVSTQPGLQLLTRDGEWMPLTLPAGAVVCDTGDIMSLLTGGRLPATTHRVVNPELDAHLPRLSLPFFCHPDPEFLLQPFDGGPGVSAAEFLMQRLRDIGVA